MGCFTPDVKVEQAPPPQPPKEGVQEWAEALPAIYEAQLKYEPKILQQRYALTSAYAPLLIEPYMALQAKYQPRVLAREFELQKKYIPEMARLAERTQAELYPYTVGLQEQLARQAAEGMQTEIPDWLREKYLSEIKANLGANVGSPIGAEYTSRRMLELQKSWQDYYRNLALTTTGRMSLTQPTPINVPQVPMPQIGTTGWLQGFSPQAVLGYRASTYGSWAGSFQPTYLPPVGPQIMSATGSLLRGIGSLPLGGGG